MRYPEKDLNMLCLALLYEGWIFRVSIIGSCNIDVECKI